nr:hypothetical protein [Tanacetum cinerariifolium]
MTPGRRYGYVRLYLYPTKEDFYANDGKYFAILIRKWDIRVVGVQLVSGKIFEIGRDYETERYFFNSTSTGFGQQYGELFKGTGINGDLVGTWIGFEVLNQAILRVICNPNPSEWAWSIGVFTLTFSECIRFVWSLRRVNNLIENKTNTRMYGEDTYMALIPKEWRNISDCARRNLEPGERTEAQPEDEKYTL